MPCNFTYYFTIYNIKYIILLLQLHISTLLVSITNNFGTFPRKNVNTRLESKYFFVKCRNSLICLENTSHNIFQKHLKMYPNFVGIGYISISVNKRVHITEKTALMTKSIFSLFTYLQFSFCFEN